MEKRKTVSIGRVKPAYVWDDTDDIPLTGISKQQTDETDHHSKDKTMSHINKAEPQPNEKTVNKTRSGRHVRFPKDLEQAANRELTHLHSPTNRSAPYPLLKSRTITQDFFPPKPDGVSAHDGDVTLLPYLILQSPCHYRKSHSGNTFLQSGLSTSIRSNTPLLGEGGSC
ncbi:hypothetical protein TNCV_2360171 [Trichonephila clavipes]|nr:hypothetical protein TNCV_2360171 [Trichonephila clavipes]